MTWREINCDQFNALKRATLVDVRSPCEFAAERIPGSINMPLFSDQERDFIGTIYAREGELVARRRAMDIISPKIPTLIDTIVAARSGNNAPLVIHCWRGGLRSEAVASCLSIVGIDCWRLSGGYKAWRKGVLRDFAQNKYRFRLVVLQGHTGAGKTDVLKALAQIGAKVIDLENLANHRGSVFGAIGLGSQPSQKDFDSSLWLAVQSLADFDGIVFAEAEGKSIGRLHLPDFIFRRMQTCPRILVDGSISARCRRIIADYTGSNGSDQVLSSELIQASNEALAAIKERVSGPILRNVKDLIATNRLSEAVELLLVHYYDHYYARHIDEQSFELTVCGDQPDQAASQILTWSRQSAVSFKV